MMYAVLSTIEPDRSQAHAPAWAGAGGMGPPLSPCPELGTWSGYPPANTRQLDTRQCQYEPLPEPGGREYRLATGQNTLFGAARLATQSTGTGAQIGGSARVLPVLFDHWA